MKTIMLLLALQGDPLSALLGRLDDEAIEVRSKAADDLAALGEAARPALEKALGGEPPDDRGARIREVIARIDREKRRRGFKGGPVVGGLSARLELSADPETKELVVKVEILNVGTERRTIAPIATWSVDSPCHGEHSPNAEAEVVVKQLSGDGPSATGFSAEVAEERVREGISLGPGESRVYERRLPARGAGAGEYEISAVYYARKFAGLDEDLKTNVAKATLSRARPSPPAER